MEQDEVRDDAEEAVIAYRSKHPRKHLRGYDLEVRVEQEIRDTQDWRDEHNEPRLTGAQVERYRTVWAKFYEYLEEPGPHDVPWAFQEV